MSARALGRAGGLAAVVALALALAPAAPAGILALEDAQEAAQALAEAQAEQDVCYGWNITNDFDGTPDLGSSTTGPGVLPVASLCERYVYLVGNIHYSCSSCEDSDSAQVDIETNLTPAPTRQDLTDLGLDAGALTGDNDDVALLNMIGALPLLAAQTGAVPPVPAEVPASVPATDVATNRPGSDFLRESWLKLVFFVFLIGSGVVFFLYKRSQVATAERRAEARRRHAEGLSRLRQTEAHAPPPPAPGQAPWEHPSQPPPTDPRNKET